VFHPPPPLFMFYYSSLFDFQFCGAAQIWMPFSDSGDELCDPLPSLLQGVAFHPPTLSLHCLSCVCLQILWHWD
jgi:hypothetical protein